MKEMKTYIKSLLAAFVLVFAGVTQSLADTKDAYNFAVILTNHQVTPGECYIDFEYPDLDYDGNDDAMRNIKYTLILKNGSSVELSYTGRCHDDMVRKNSSYGAMQVIGERTTRNKNLRIIKMRYWPSGKALVEADRMKFEGWWDVDDNSKWTQSGPDDYNVIKDFDLRSLFSGGTFYINQNFSLKYDGGQYYASGYNAQSFSGWSNKVWFVCNGSTVYAESTPSSSMNLSIYEFGSNNKVYANASVSRTISVRNGCYDKYEKYSSQTVNVTQRLTSSVSTEGCSEQGPSFIRLSSAGRDRNGHEMFNLEVLHYNSGTNFDVYRREKGSSESARTRIADSQPLYNDKGVFVDETADIEKSYVYDFNLRSNEWSKHRFNNVLNRTADMTAIQRPSGSGTDDDPYIVGSPYDFSRMCWFTNSGKIMNKVWKLTSDITLDSDSFYSAGSEDSHFFGTFNGSGHTITLDRVSARSDDTALFGYIDGATISDLRVAGSISTGYKFGAGIAAAARGGKITNCRVSLDISSSINGDGTHAGIVGHTYYLNGTPTLIENCIFDGSIKGSSTIACGGIVGWNDRSNACTIRNTLCLATFNLNTEACDIMSRNGAIVENSYYLNELGTNNCGAVKLDESHKGTGLLDTFRPGIYAYRPGTYPMLKMFGDGNTADIVADGSTSLLTSVSYSGIDFTLNGTFKAGQTCTLILPFDLSESEAEEMGEFYELQHFDSATRSVYFRRLVGSLKGGVPYIFKPAVATDHYSFSGRTLMATASMPDASAAPAQQSLVGTFSPVTAPAGAYGYSAGNDGAHAYGQFVKVGSSVSLPSFRAYLWLTGSAPATLNAVFADEDGSVTAIEQVESDSFGDAPQTIYSLDGRKLDSPEKGINIINGRKVVVR